MKRTFIVLSVIAIAFIGGVIFQRFVTVGRSILWVKSFFYDAEAAAVGLSEPVAGGFDWSPYASDLEGIRLQRRDTGEAAEEATLIRSRAAAETAYRGTEAASEAYGILAEAKRTNGVTAMEVRHNLFLRREELEYQRDDGFHSEHWEKRCQAVLGFHELLADRGIHLIFMPVPNQVDIELPALLGADEYVSSGPKHTEFLLALADAGVDVIDLRYEFGERVLDGINMINRFDHHWSPRGIEVAAEVAARRIAGSFGGLPAEPIRRFGFTTVYFEEPVINFPFRHATEAGSPLFARQVMVDSKPAGPYAGSEIAIFGDSMVMVYGEPYSADLGSHLSARLGYPCRVIGQGSGSPVVPKMFFETYGLNKGEGDPAVLLWICVSRHQEYAVLNHAELAKEFLNQKAGKYAVTVVRRSVVPDPKTAPYSDASYSIEATIKPEGGEPFEARVYAPAFASRKLLETSKLEAGKDYSMNLVPWAELKRGNPALATRVLIDDFKSFALPEFYWDGT